MTLDVSSTSAKRSSCTSLPLVLHSFFFSSRRRHTRCSRDWSSDVCSSDLLLLSHRTQTGRPQKAKSCSVVLPDRSIACNRRRTVMGTLLWLGIVFLVIALVAYRSEERRGGKGCRRRRAGGPC